MEPCPRLGFWVLLEDEEPDWALATAGMAGG